MTRSVTLSLGLTLCCFVSGAFAQETLKCKSESYRYRKCPVDTRGGVTLKEQLSRAACRLNETWGYDRDGIWVDRGCQAEFTVGGRRSDSGATTPGNRWIAACERAIRTEVQKDFGRSASIVFDSADTTRESNRRERISGEAVVQENRRSTPIRYECLIDSNQGRVLRADFLRDADASSPDPGTSECDRFPILFRNDDFEGQKMVLEADVQDLHRRNFGDRASSICVPRGWEVVLYEDTRFRGEKLTLRGPHTIADLKRDRPAGRNWGDRISSVEVQRVSVSQAACRQTPVLYEHDGFKGRQLPIQASIADLRRYNFGDRISSICVPRGWTLLFYEDRNYRGDVLEMRGEAVINNLEKDRPNGKDWGDRIDSVKVQRRR